MKCTVEHIENSELFQELLKITSKDNAKKIFFKVQEMEWAYEPMTYDNGEVHIKEIIDNEDLISDHIRREYYSLSKKEQEMAREVNIIEDLVTQIQGAIRELENQISNETDTQIRIKLNDKIKAFREQRRLLLSQRNPAAVREVAERNIAYAKNVLNSARPTAQEIFIANRLLSSWSFDKTSRLLTDQQRQDDTNEYKKALLDIANRADDIRSGDEGMTNFMIDFINDYLNDMDPERVFDDFTRDYFKGLEDIGTLSRYFTPLSMSTSQIGQEYLQYLQNVRRNTDSKIDEFISKLSDIFKDIDYSNLMQKDEKGNPTPMLISPAATSYYKKKSKAFNVLQYRMNAAEDLERVKKGKKRAYSDFIYKRSAEEVPIDVRYLMDDLESPTDMSREEYIEDVLMDALPDKNNANYRQYVELAIAKAEQEYERYLKEKKAVEEARFIEATRDQMIDIGENETKSEWMKRKVEEWELENDPLIHIDALKEPRKAIKHQNKGWHYANSIPKKAEGYNAEYKSLSVKEMNALNEVMSINEHIMNMLPSRMVKDKSINMIPALKKNIAEQIFETGIYSTSSEFVKSLLDRITEDEQLSLLSNESIRNEGIFDKVTASPVDHIFDQDGITTLERSLDLKRVLQVAYGAAITHRQMTEVADVADTMVDLVRQADKLDTRNQTIVEGEAPQNLLQAMEYAATALIGGKKRMDEMTIDSITTSINPIKNAKNKVKLKKLERKRDRLFEAIEEGTAIPEDVFAEATKSLNELKKISEEKLKDNLTEEQRKAVENRIGVYNNRLEKIKDYKKAEEKDPEEIKETLLLSLDDYYKSFNPRNLNMAKTLDETVIKFAQIQGLGWNLRAGITNALFGILSGSMHAAGQQDYTAKEFRAAMMHIIRELTSGGEKIARMVRSHNILFEVRESMYGNYTQEDANKLDGKAKYRFIASGMGVWEIQKRTEFFAQGITFVAKMLNTEVIDKNGNVRNYFEAHDSEGNWKVDEFGEPGKWTKDVEGTTVNKYTKFRNSIVQLNKYLHGDYDPNSTMEVKSFSLGRLIMMFKTWIPANVVYRYSGEYMDAQLGRKIKGIHRSAYDILSEYGVGGLLTATGAAAAKNFTNVKVGSDTISELDMRNLAIVLKEIYLWSVITSIMVALTALVRSTGDDDPVDYAAKSIMNQLYRLRQDIDFYINPVSAMDVIRNPIPVLGSIDDFSQAMSDAVKWMENEDYKGDDPLQNTYKFLPFTRQLHNIHFAMTDGIPGGIKENDE
jgi:hypothetical protein